LGNFSFLIENKNFSMTQKTLSFWVSSVDVVRAISVIKGQEVFTLITANKKIKPRNK